jgi:3-hydroxyisobutyrate dehydrogenase-like beta-hydroxyacid dehydrogenase
LVNKPISISTSVVNTIPVCEPVSTRPWVQNIKLVEQKNIAMAQTNGIHRAKKIGYIGLGNAGYPLASTLAKAGYHLVVQDADPKRAEKFALEHHNSSAAEDGTSFSDIDVLVTMLPNGDIVRDVLLGSDGIAKSLKNGAVIIDTSSSSPFHTQETGKLVADLNSTFTLIDSPVTQEYAHALGKGDATLMVGCSNSAALDLAMPILKTMAKHVFVMGELGAGHAMKTLNNYTSAASIMGLCDALIAGQKFGLDPKTMVDVMNVGTGVNFSTKESFRTDVSRVLFLMCAHADVNDLGTYEELRVGIPAFSAVEGYEDRTNAHRRNWTAFSTLGFDCGAICRRRSNRGSRSLPYASDPGLGEEGRDPAEAK